MKCPKCQFENRDEAKFCGECGYKFEISCPKCGADNRAKNKFCDECGANLKPAREAPDQITKTKSPPVSPLKETIAADNSTITSERKYVTVLFSDLTGYTAMSERLDPEELKDITSQIFAEISNIIYKYDGFIEKFAGDAVMALFGAATSHEDDPVRAIHASREIHSFVKSLNPKYKNKIEHPLSMHTGINTGLVVTGEINLEKGLHGVAGDAINVAARLSDLAKAEEILVASDTYYQAQGYFDFEELGPTAVKGKSDPIRVYKVLSVKGQPVKVHRLYGLRAELIGRTVEMNKLAEALHSLKEGKGSAISICGAAGTGKSRLVGDFRDSLYLQEIQWLEGHAYPFSQNIPYYPLIGLLAKAWQIEEGDSPERIKEKVDSGIFSLFGKRTEVVPYIGSLFSLNYSEIENVNPELWKAQLQKAVQTILSQLARKAPTIICLEDLHWADPSFLELTRMLLSDFREPILFLCIYRPAISLFTSHEIKAMVNPYQEIFLRELSPSESQQMVESLLKTQTIPSDLLVFIHDKVEGNPFYIEEMINSLIESKTLVPVNEGWITTRSISESDISATIHGVISSRLDRLEKEAKRILQEASVIGRSFLYDILIRISEIEKHIDSLLSGLEQLDIVKTKTINPYLEYIFKHALTQEVVYNGLLKKERKKIHNRIGLVIEQIFHERLPEFYETIAFHFTLGQNISKAVEYLLKSGNKCMLRYSLIEANEFFKQAYEQLNQITSRNDKENLLLIKTIGIWAYVFNLNGNYTGLLNLLVRHHSEAMTLEESEEKGMYYTWLGWTLQRKERLYESYDCLKKALDLGRKIKNNKIIGYGYNWLIWTCTDLGRLDEAKYYGELALNQHELITSDPNYYRYILAGLGIMNYVNGNVETLIKISEELISIGERDSDFRCMTHGYLYKGLGHYSEGNNEKALKSFHRAIEVAADPIFSYNAKILLGGLYVVRNNLKEAEKMLKGVITFSEQFGSEYIGTAALTLNGIVMIAKGQLKRGVNLTVETLQALKENGSIWRYASLLHLLGRVYSQIAINSGPKKYSVLIRNLGFLLKTMPTATSTAEQYFNEAADVAKKIDAKIIMAQAYFDLGLLHKAKKRNNSAKRYISKAIKIFSQCGAKEYKKIANEALEF